MIANIYSDSGPIAFRNGGSTTFEHQNWVGTQRLRTTYNGSVYQTYNSLPFGDNLSPNGDNGDQYDFAGLDRDLEDNSEHAQFRQYSPAQGRWLSPDPYSGSYDFSNPQSFNRYAYGLNDPVNLRDPSGLDCVFFTGDGSPVIGGGNDFDEDSGPRHCADDGGDWINGTVEGYGYDPSSGVYTFQSQDSNNQYVTGAVAPSDASTIASSVTRRWATVRRFGTSLGAAR